MGYTEFGKYVRKKMVDRDENLLDLAKVLNVSTAFISSVFTGKKNAPESWLDEIIMHYSLNDKDCFELRNAFEESKNEITINVINANIEQKKLAVQFQRKLSNLDQCDIDKLMKILEKGDKA